MDDFERLADAVVRIGARLGVVRPVDDDEDDAADDEDGEGDDE